VFALSPFRNMQDAMNSLVLWRLERVRFELNHDRALSFCFDAFSSREPVSTSLENALERFIF
jgi:hypothetical protein